MCAMHVPNACTQGVHPTRASNAYAQCMYPMPACNTCAPSQGLCSLVMQPFPHPHPWAGESLHICCFQTAPPTSSCPDFLLCCFRKKISYFFSQGHQEGKCISVAPGWLLLLKQKVLLLFLRWVLLCRLLAASPWLCIYTLCSQSMGQHRSIF